MTDNEVNKIIAEYMHSSDIDLIESDYKTRQEVVDSHYFYYTNSLDALVPVWKKLKVQYFSFDKWNNYLVDMHTDSSCDTTRIKGKTIQQASARATAKAILELNKEE